MEREKATLRIHKMWDHGSLSWSQLLMATDSSTMTYPDTLLQDPLSPPIRLSGIQIPPQSVPPFSGSQLSSGLSMHLNPSSQSMVAIPLHILGTTQISWHPFGRGIHTWPSGHDFVQLHFPAWMSRGEEDTRVKDKTSEARVESFIVMMASR